MSIISLYTNVIKTKLIIIWTISFRGETHVPNTEFGFTTNFFNSSKSKKISPWKRADASEEENERAKKAYEALMTVTMRMPETPEYQNFSKEVKKLALDKYNFDYGKEEVSVRFMQKGINYPD